ncbi:MAG: hypothetical protein NC340_09125 [Ruminococcus flavefaciens]|nr:hypothetical protein [Ruminococcus flavefaciens]MCM1230612.1 hypothetical protein [Ruminococcus flavefaciens]
MKKLISTLAASAMIAASLSCVSAFAVGKTSNGLNIKTETLSCDVMADNGMVVPAGSVAVTVSIKNNTGFDSSANKLTVGEAYSFIAESELSPAITAGEAMGDSMVCAVENGSEIVVTSASAKYNYADGAMFTFYLEKNAYSSDTRISFTEIPEEIVIPVTSVASTYSTNATYLNFFYGDVDAPFTSVFKITSTDASAVMRAINKYMEENPNAKSPDEEDGGIPLDVVNANVDKYFPKAVCGQAADVNKSKFINNADVDDILLFYSCASSSTPEDMLDRYHEKTNNGHCGELGFVQASTVTR